MKKWFAKIKSQSKTLAISTSYVFIGKVFSGVFSTLIFIFLARILAVEEFGTFSFFTSVAAMLSVASNWGLNEYILREGAAVPEKLGVLVRNSMFIKGFLGVVFGLLTSGYLLFKLTLLSNLLIFVLILLYILIDSQTITYIMAFRSQGNTRFEAWFFPSRNALRLLSVVLISLWRSSLTEIICGMVLVNVAGFWVGRLSFSRFRQQRQSGKINFRSAFELAKSATPFVLLAVSGMAYARADQIILGIMKGNHEVGVYALAWQVYETATFLSVSIGTVLLPKLTTIFNENAYRWLERGAKAFGLALLFGILIGVSLSIALPYVIRYIFAAKYLASEPAIRMLMVAYIFNFVWVAVLVCMFISGGNARMLNLIVIFNLTLNLLINIYAIPRYGPLGAAISTIVSEFSSFAIGTFWLFKKFSEMKLAAVKG